MKHQNAKLLVRALKTFTVLFFWGFLFFSLVAMKTKKMADDLWKQLGITQLEANQNITNSFEYGQLSYWGAKNAKNILAGDRVAVINELAAYSKKYIAGNEFRHAYQDYREKHKPAQPYLYTISRDSIVAVEKARIETQMKQAEENKNSPNPKVRNGVPYAIENLKKQLADLDNPENRIIKTRMNDMQRSNDYALKLYNDALQKWETEYPADPDQILKKRLQRILDITADVDYTAELKDGGKYKVFVNPAYEAKPKEWKLAYRAGKAATDAVRKIAEDWLKQLK